MKKIRINKSLLLIFICIAISMVSIFSLKRVNNLNLKMYATSLQYNFVHINDAKVYLNQIIDDYDEIEQYDLSLFQIAEKFSSVFETIQIIEDYSSYKLNESKSIKSYSIFNEYATMIKDWGIAIHENDLNAYPTIEELKALKVDLDKYSELFYIEHDSDYNKVKVGGTSLKSFSYNYIANRINKIVKDSYFEKIREFQLNDL